MFILNLKCWLFEESLLDDCSADCNYDFNRLKEKLCKNCYPKKEEEKVKENVQKENCMGKYKKLEEVRMEDSEYNLSWEQAVEAMQRGESVKSAIHRTHKIIDGVIGYVSYGGDFAIIEPYEIKRYIDYKDGWKIITNEEKVKEYTFEEAFGNGTSDEIEFRISTKDRDDNFFYFRKNGHIYGTSYRNIKLDIHTIIHLSKFKFIKVEDEKPKENGLGLGSYKITTNYSTWIEGSGEEKIVKALDIYKRLLSHHLVVKLTNDGEFYLIETEDLGEGLFLDICLCSLLEYTFFRLSPCFKNKENAEQAIKDIGEDNLLFMFKALNGVE
jgi:hypothetical protein